MDKLQYLIPLFAANSIYNMYNNKTQEKNDNIIDNKLQYLIPLFAANTVYNMYNKKKQKTDLIKDSKTDDVNEIIINLNINNKQNSNRNKKIPTHKNIDYKMNQIYYLVKKIYKIHSVLSSVIRIKNKSVNCNGTIKKNLQNISSLLINIKKSIPNKYHFKEHLYKYGNIIFKLTEKLIDKDYDVLDCLALSDKIIEDWYYLHENYYINSKNN